ncbi:hypothetical protein BDR26DRAFT_870439 [Obelidium mucronatum]|nr:hypothetical protein BDR26DRAFT_870439 [Obelidium mucronatum]
MVNIVEVYQHSHTPLTMYPPHPQIISQTHSDNKLAPLETQSKLLYRRFEEESGRTMVRDGLKSSLNSTIANSNTRSSSNLFHDLNPSSPSPPTPQMHRNFQQNNTLREEPSDSCFSDIRNLLAGSHLLMRTSWRRPREPLITNTISESNSHVQTKVEEIAPPPSPPHPTSKRRSRPIVRYNPLSTAGSRQYLPLPISGLRIEQQRGQGELQGRGNSYHREASPVSQLSGIYTPVLASSQWSLAGGSLWGSDVGLAVLAPACEEHVYSVDPQMKKETI